MNARIGYTAGTMDATIQPVQAPPPTEGLHGGSCLSAGVDYDIHGRTGSIILNITCVPASCFDKALPVIGSVLQSPYAFSNRFVLAAEHARLGGFKVPAHTFAVGTVCSLTLNGLLLGCAIHARPKFGGVVEIKNGVPKNFSAFLSSGESPLAPLEDFLNGSMTSVMKTLQTGSGQVLASFVEIPGSTLHKAKDLYERLKPTGMGGKILFGRPSQPLLGMPVSIGCAAMVVYRDINTVAGLYEQAIVIKKTAKILFPFQHMHSADTSSCIHSACP